MGRGGGEDMGWKESVNDEDEKHRTRERHIMVLNAE
jgi:hypothetical protein